MSFRADLLNAAYDYVFENKTFGDVNQKVTVASQFAAYYIGNFETPLVPFEVVYQRFIMSEK